jgi:hypothetical protein
MRWRLQRPARKAVERDEAEIARWVAQEWPRMAPTPERAEPGSASSTSRASSRPRRCAGPGRPRAARRCCLPPLPGGKQLSMCGLVADRHSDGDGEQVAAWMGFDLLEDAYDTRQCIRVLDSLGHQPVTVIWDNLGAHHAGDLRAWAATQPWLELKFPRVSTHLHRPDWHRICQNPSSPATIVMLRGSAKGESTARLSREIDLDRKTPGRDPPADPDQSL